MEQQLNIRVRDVLRDNWMRVRQYRDSYRLVETPQFCGMVGLMQVLEMDGPLIFQFDGAPLLVADTGYYWMQLAPENGNWWLTVMYDQALQPRQAYIDITGENHILPQGRSWFTDLFLDVVIMPDGRIRLLDQDELELALAQKVIDQQQYLAATAQAQAIQEAVQNRVPQFFAWAEAHFLAMKEILHQEYQEKEPKQC